MIRDPKIAQLDRRVSFLRSTLIDDGYQQIEGPFIPHGGVVWAAKMPVSDSEKFRNGVVDVTVTTRFQVRWSSFMAGITREDRLVCEGVEYGIAGIKEIGRREGIEISCITIGPAPAVDRSGVVVW